MTRITDINALTIALLFHRLVKLTDTRLGVESGELHLLRRRPEDQVCYERRREEIITEYGSMTQYVVTQLLKWEDLIDPTTKYTKMVDSLASFDPSLAKLLPNDFPYAIDAAVSHYVLWYKAPLQRTSALDGFLKEQFPGHDILFFVNPPHLQSIRTIHHGHVFVRRQS
ncbi:hypothetical protein IWQ61_001549 [Dispira simplex]|nr:hypothetical protein IWQ61_001549 [Dispira simplex]